MADLSNAATHIITVHLLTSQTMKEESPGAHADTLVIEHRLLGAFWCIRVTTVHILTHKVGEEHIVAHETHPPKQLREEEAL